MFYVINLIKYILILLKNSRFLMTREDCLYCVEKEKSNNVSTWVKWMQSRPVFKI